MTYSTDPPSYDTFRSLVSNADTANTPSATTAPIERAPVVTASPVYLNEPAEAPVQRAAQNVSNVLTLPNERTSNTNTSNTNASNINAGSTPITTTELESTAKSQHDFLLPPDYYGPVRRVNDNSEVASIASTALPDYSRRNAAKSDVPGPSTWGRYKTEEEYLAALRAFVHEKEFMSSDNNTLTGFYGTKTVEEWVDEKGRKRRQEKREQKKEQKKREKEAKNRNKSAADGSSIAARSSEGGSVYDLSSQRGQGNVASWLKSRVKRRSISERSIQTCVV